MATRPKVRTLEQRVIELEQGLWYSTELLAYQLAQTRFACDCIFHFMTRGAADGIPWDDMGPHQPGPDESPPTGLVVPSRAVRRQAARAHAKRVQGMGQ